MILFLIGGFLIGGVAVTFALQNTETVIVALFTWRFESSLALVIILALAIGALVSSLISLPRNVRKSLQISNLKKQNSQLEKELAERKRAEVEKTKLATANASPSNSENTHK